jgi:hypothetical protein
MQQEKLTVKEALEIIGQALSHDTLKLSQREHIIIIEAFKTLKDEYIEEPVAKLQVANDTKPTV